MKERILKILMLEDNPYDADLLRIELKKSEWIYTYEVVQTREKFEAALHDFKPDIILSDYTLPSFDAVSAFQIKQKLCPSVPFIIISGTIGEENAVELIKNGVTDYALKDKLFTVTQKMIRALREAEEKKNTEERRKEYIEALEGMLNITSHKVRRPVSTYLGLIDTLNTDKLYSQEELKKIIEIWKNSALELEAFTKELTMTMHNLKEKNTLK